MGWDGRGRHSGGLFNGTNLSYEFDPLGFRRERTVDTAVAHYLHGGLLETDAQGTVTLADVDGPPGDLAYYLGEPETGTEVTFLYWNGHGDLAAEADAAGVRTADSSYDPFGALRSGGTPVNSTAERYTGRRDKKLDATTVEIKRLVQTGAYGGWATSCNCA